MLISEWGGQRVALWPPVPMVWRAVSIGMAWCGKRVVHEELATFIACMTRISFSLQTSIMELNEVLLYKRHQHAPLIRMDARLVYMQAKAPTPCRRKARTTRLQYTSAGLKAGEVQALR